MVLISYLYNLETNFMTFPKKKTKVHNWIKLHETRNCSEDLQTNRSSWITFQISMTCNYSYSFDDCDGMYIAYHITFESSGSFRSLEWLKSVKLCNTWPIYFVWLHLHMSLKFSFTILIMLQLNHEYKCQTLNVDTQQHHLVKEIK